MNTQEDSYLNLSEMTVVIQKFLEKNNITYKSITSCLDIQILYQLIQNENRSRLNKLSSNVKYIAGLFFETIRDTQSMMTQYLEGVNSGCSECMNLLGRYYFKNKDYAQMMEFWKVAIEKNNLEAMFNMTKFFEEQKQYDKMVQALQMAIDLGSEKAIHSLASYYANNRKTDKMIETYRKGAHVGFTSCMIELGKYYISQRDHDNAAKYFTAASKTNPEAMYRLGMIFEFKKEYTKMIEIYTRAIQHNHSESMIRLGDYYKKIKNYDMMIHIYKMAAENKIATQTSSDAMNKLGIYYQKKKQYSEMLKYYHDAIKLGCVNAMNNLAIYYESIGEVKKMKELLEKAIEKNSSAAMYNMGLYYEKTRNYDKMAEYFMMSYQNGRIFDYSEIKLMKKSIVRLQKPNFGGFIKSLDEKKKQLKEFFKRKQKSPKEKKKSKLERSESKFKFSKENQKEDILIDIPQEKPNTLFQPLFHSADLYKIFGNMDNTKVPMSTKIESNIIDSINLQSSYPPVSNSHSFAPNTHQNTKVNQSLEQNLFYSEAEPIVETKQNLTKDDVHFFKMALGLRN